MAGQPFDKLEFEFLGQKSCVKQLAGGEIYVILIFPRVIATHNYNSDEKLTAAVKGVAKK